VEEKMDRREFLRRFFGIGAAAGAAYMLGGTTRLWGAEGGQRYDMAAVLGGEPAGMFEEGIAALGGMGRFVRKGQTVAIKPNASWAAPPEQGATTTPALVERIAEHCREAGARRVYVLDHTIDSWRSSYQVTGIERAAKNGGAQVVPANSKGYYQEVQVPGARKLTSVMVHEQVMEADVLINVPILKDHGSTVITSALKNLMGLVWSRWFYHANDLHRCIAEFPLFRAPTLNVVDAHTVMLEGGPRGSSHRASLARKRMQIISPDIVAVDAAAAQTFGVEPRKVRYIGIAEELNLGSMDLDRLSIKRIRV
jgi:uncharacterized protein (DUF362 family)